MKQSTKAALLSALIFPGAGHLYLRQYIRGVLLSGVSAVLLYFIVSVAVNTAFEVLDKMQNGEVPPNVEAISELVLKQSQGTDELTNTATLALIVLWVIGIGDSYRQGRRQELSGGISDKDQRGSQR